MAKKPEPKETDIEKGILQWLNMQAGVRAWKIQSVGVPDGHGKMRPNNSPYSMKGMADIHAIWCGLNISIEVKRPSRRNELTPLQKKYLEEVHDHGGLAMIVTSIEEVQNHFRALRESIRGQILWILKNRPKYELESLLLLYNQKLK